MRLRRQRQDTHEDLKRLVVLQKQQLQAITGKIHEIWDESQNTDLARGRHSAATEIQTALDAVIMRRARMTNVTTRRDGGSTYLGGDAR